MHWYIWPMLWLIHIIFLSSQQSYDTWLILKLFILNTLWNNWWIWSNLVLSIDTFYAKTCNNKNKNSGGVSCSACNCFGFFCLSFPQKWLLKRCKALSIEVSMTLSIQLSKTSRIINVLYSARTCISWKFRSQAGEIPNSNLEKSKRGCTSLFLRGSTSSNESTSLATGHDCYTNFTHWTEWKKRKKKQLCNKLRLVVSMLD